MLCLLEKMLFVTKMLVAGGTGNCKAVLNVLDKKW